MRNVLVAGLGSALIACGALSTAGCVIADADVTDDGESVGESQSPLITDFGYIYQGGTLATFADVVSPSGITLSKVVGLAACGPKTLYAVQNDGGSPTAFSIWFSNDSGLNWSLKSNANTPGKGPEIACDHSMLLTLDGAGTLFTAPLQSTGAIGLWTAKSMNTTVNRIQGGDGTIYGVKNVAGGNQLFVTSARSINALENWTGPIATIGATLVTGTGTTKTGTDSLPVSNSLAWSRRAFALEANGTFSTNSKILEGNNFWTGFNSGNERYTVLTAAGPDVLYGLQNKSGVIHINRITITETSCSDGVDNDADGLKDGEDPDCVQTVANTFCSTRPNGRYCADRFQPGFFLDQANQSSSLVLCFGSSATVYPGVCQRNPDPAITNDDSLLSYDQLTPPEPAGFGHWCNVQWPDGTWDFNWTGSTPCDTLLNAKPGGKIVRAGLYSISGANNAYVSCSDGAPGPAGALGDASLQALYNAVTHGTNSCLFTVSPAALPIFSKPYNLSDEVPNRIALPFIHSLPSPEVDLSQFGNSQTGTSDGVDRFGIDKGPREVAYDLPLDEGRPLLAVSGGVVIKDGSRDRDLTGMVPNGGSPNQGEIYVKYSVGSDPTYQETFVVYYAHLRKRLVKENQTVKAGQILGYVGATGWTGGFAHLHMAVLRLSNINAHTAAAPEFGYHVDFKADNDNSGNNMGGWNAVDPLGWAAPSGFDPWGYLYRNNFASSNSLSFNGIGAWNIALFKSGQAFTYTP